MIVVLVVVFVAGLATAFAVFSTSRRQGRRRSAVVDAAISLSITAVYAWFGVLLTFGWSLAVVVVMLALAGAAGATWLFVAGRALAGRRGAES